MWKSEISSSCFLENEINYWGMMNIFSNKSNLWDCCKSEKGKKLAQQQLLMRCKGGGHGWGVDDRGKGSIQIMVLLLVNILSRFLGKKLPIYISTSNIPLQPSLVSRWGDISKDWRMITFHGTVVPYSPLHGICSHSLLSPILRKLLTSARKVHFCPFSVHSPYRVGMPLVAHTQNQDLQVSFSSGIQAEGWRKDKAYNQISASTLGTVLTSCWHHLALLQAQDWLVSLTHPGMPSSLTKIGFLHFHRWPQTS